MGYMSIFAIIMKFTTVALFTVFISMFCSCGSSPDDEKAMPAQSAPVEKAIKEQFVKANQLLVEREKDMMDYYEKSHRLPFTATASGIRYHVYKPAAAGDSIKPGMLVTMNFTVSLLDGTVCYSSAQEGKKSFVVEEDRIESGIHRGLQYLKKGDKALIMIPSALAHGLLGDFDKIPPQMPIVYNVKIDPN